MIAPRLNLRSLLIVAADRVAGRNLHSSVIVRSGAVKAGHITNSGWLRRLDGREEANGQFESALDGFADPVADETEPWVEGSRDLERNFGVAPRSVMAVCVALLF
jgi:hypothetical protein